MFVALRGMADACLPPKQLRGVVTSFSGPSTGCANRQASFIPIDDATIAWADGVVGSSVECAITCASRPWFNY